MEKKEKEEKNLLMTLEKVKAKIALIDDAEAQDNTTQQIDEQIEASEAPNWKHFRTLYENSNQKTITEIWKKLS